MAENTAYPITSLAFFNNCQTVCGESKPICCNPGAMGTFGMTAGEDNPPTECDNNWGPPDWFKKKMTFDESVDVTTLLNPMTSYGFSVKIMNTNDVGCEGEPEFLTPALLEWRDITTNDAWIYLEFPAVYNDECFDISCSSILLTYSPTANPVLNSANDARLQDYTDLDIGGCYCF